MGAVSGCGNLIGLGGYSVADDAAGSGGTKNTTGGSVDGGRAGTEIADGGTSGAPDDNGESGAAGASGSGETSGSSGTSGSAGTSGSPGTSGSAGGGGGGPATCPGGCDDLNDCTSDSCVLGACKHDVLAVGTACGVARSCDAQALCVRCRDTAAGTAQDAGCSPAAPVCIGTGLEAACGGCTTPADCNDGNACTTETCTAGKCVFATVAAGSMCATGVCNGTASMEKCVACADTAAGAAQDAGCTSAKPVCDASTGTPTCYECLTGSDCATDNVSCTVETCTNHVCSHVATDSLCTPSGDVCKPNKCDASLSCKQVDITASKDVIATGTTVGNGGFEQVYAPDPKNYPNLFSAVGWTDVGDYTIIYACPSGCTASNGLTYTGPGGANHLAWLGGTKQASITSIDRLIVLPAGTVKIQVTADMNFQTKVTGTTKRDLFEVRLLDAAKAQAGPALYSASNLNAQTGTATSWTADGIKATSDVSAYVVAHPGGDSYISFWSSVLGGGNTTTDFFIDNVRLNATVCQ